MATTVFELNGQTVRVDDVDPHCTLLAWLRAAGHTGTKEGCAEGECGACAVAWLGRDADGRARYEPVNSCLVPLSEVHGRSLVTVEGVSATGGNLVPLRLHPVQKALVEAGGSQCGYCTPGFVISLFCEYYRPGRRSYDPEAISGNLCRCTGYRPIIEAARSLGRPSPDDAWLGQLEREVPALPAFAHTVAERRFLRPTSSLELANVLREHPEAVLLAGGTDLMVYANQRGTRYPTLVSLAAIPELRACRVSNQEIVIGAALPLSHLEQLLEHPEYGADLALLRRLLPLFSSRLIRNRATLGGNLATASPIGDAAPALLALGAELTLDSAAGSRRLPLSDFFVGYRKTALAPGEWIASVHLPLPLPRLQRFYKVSKRVLDDISTVAAAFALDLRQDGRVERLRVAWGGVAATPLRAEALEGLAVGEPWNGETLSRLVEVARSIGTPLSDHRGSAEYRRAMLGKLLERFHAETTAGAGGRS
ncbi:MAG TPA: FAD binding domain-containing protein [Polyangiaceae bacterium]|nr:FAD binding domain-containing protein [Polyangiaceae bacterium]